MQGAREILVGMGQMLVVGGDVAGNLHRAEEMILLALGPILRHQGYEGP